MTIVVNVLPALNVIQLADTLTGDCVLLDRSDCTAFLGDFMRAMAATIPDGDQSRNLYSLPDVDGYEVGSAKADHLRLVESGER